MDETEKIIQINNRKRICCRKTGKVKRTIPEKINEPVSAVIYEFNLQAKDEAVLKLRALISDSKGKPFKRHIRHPYGEFRPLTHSCCNVLISIFVIACNGLSRAG